jgi:hypothetical protein
MAPAQPDTRTEQQRMLDNAGLGAAKAEDYRPIDYMGRMPEGVELFAFDTDAKSFLAAIGAPALIGPSMLEDACDAAKGYPPPGPVRDLYRMTEQSRIVDLYGPEKTLEIYASMAEVLASEAIPNAFAIWLAESGALAKAEVVISLARIADLRKARAAA